MGVKAFDAVLATNFVCQTEAVSADDLAVFLVPEKEVVIMGIEHVDIAVATRPFTDSAERHLSEAADFAHDRRAFIETGDVDVEVAARQQKGFRRKRGDFGLNLFNRRLGQDFLLNDGGLFVAPADLEELVANFLLTTGFEGIRPESKVFC